MKALYAVSVLLALIIAAASSSPSGSQTQLEATGHGIVDSVRNVRAHPAGYAGAVEHAVGPSEEIVVRLDDGQTLTIVQDTGEHFEPEDRVLLSRSKIGVRLEHARR